MFQLVKYICNSDYRNSSADSRNNKTDLTLVSSRIGMMREVSQSLLLNWLKLRIPIFSSSTDSQKEFLSLAPQLTPPRLFYLLLLNWLTLRLPILSSSTDSCQDLHLLLSLASSPISSPYLSSMSLIFYILIKTVKLQKTGNSQR